MAVPEMAVSHGTIQHDPRNSNQGQQGAQRRGPRLKKTADEGSESVNEEDGREKPDASLSDYLR